MTADRTTPSSHGWLSIGVVGVLAACAGKVDDSSPTDDTGDTGSAIVGCRSAQPAANRTRYAVVAHPFGSGGGTEYEVLSLGTDGELARTTYTFDLDRSFLAKVVFSPDGSLGIVPQDDGSLGVFTLSADGEPTVVHAAYEGDFYAGAVTFDPSGEYAVVSDGNWRNNGGGLYRVDIDCETGALSGDQLLVSARAATDVLRLGDEAVVVARELDGETSGGWLYRVPWGDWANPTAQTDLFGDDDAIVASATLVADGRYALVGDNSAFSSSPNRVAVVDLASGATAVQVVSPIPDPVDLIASPYGNAALAVAGFEDAVYRLAVGDGPVTNLGEPSYTGASPQLPGKGAVVERGDLTGLVLVAENLGIRAFRFGSDGSITDRGLVSLGTGNPAITGAFGLQP